MKILLIGDFHGEFSQKVFNQVKKEKADLVLCTGDFCGNKKYAELFFEYIYGFGDEEIPLDIMRNIEKFEKMVVPAGRMALKKLKQLDTMTYSIRGNWDPLDYPFDIGASRVRNKDLNDAKDFLKFQDNKFKFIDFGLIELKDLVIVGGASSTTPGEVNRKYNKRLKRYYTETEIKNRIKEYKKREKIYNKNFAKAKKIGKPIIFLTHNCPYKTLDKLQQGPSKGEHYGSYLERLMIQKFKPEIVICGHIHETRGKAKLGKSKIINPGAILENKFAILDIDEKTGKYKIKFFN